MLLVPTYLAPSATHGIGLFSSDLIRRGTVVWRRHPEFDLCFSPSLIDSLEPIPRGRILHYLYFTQGFYYLCGDDARFMNHSSSPNLDQITSPEGEVFNVSNRDILPGEELTCDYSLFEERELTFLLSP